MIRLPLPLRTSLFVLSAAATATLLAGQSRTLEELARQSPLIVMGHVNSADSYTGADGEVYTAVAIAHGSVLRDEENSTAGQTELQFTVKGGIVGDRAVYFSDAPRFNAGEDVLLFAEAGVVPVETFLVDAVRGPELLMRLVRAREDAGDAPATEGAQWQRALDFLRQVEQNGRARGASIVLDAVSCSAYTGPKWSSTAITFALSANIPAAWSPVLTAAAQSWNAAGSRFAFTPDPRSPHAVALGDLGTGPTLASTRVEYSLATQLMTRFSLTFNSRYAWSLTGEAGRFDVQAIATHELGHALGLNHPADSSCSEQSMWASAATGETKKRSLEAGDKAGAVTLYGVTVSGGPTTTTPPPPPPPPAAPAAPVVTNFALVTTKAIATKPVVILLQGTGIDPAKIQGFFIGGPCGTAGCTAAPYATSDTNAVFINGLPAGTYSIAFRNGATGTLSAPRPFTVSAN